MGVICLVNPLFSASGSTELWRLGSVVIYLESLAFGACMGAMLVAVVLWLECASRVLTQDRVLELGARALPTVTLMVSMTAQLVPQLVRRGQTVRSTYAACTAASGTKDVRHAQVRMSDVLVAWAMEDSLERADAMRARGWGSTEARTTYRSVEFRARDAVALTGVVVFLLANALLAYRRVLAVAFLSHHAPARGLVGIRTVCRPGASAHGARTHGEGQGGDDRDGRTGDLDA